MLTTALDWMFNTLPGFALLFSSTAEKALHLVGAASREHAPANFHHVIELWVVQDIQGRVDGASLGIVRTVNQPLQACEHKRPGAHCTRLNGDEHLAIEQAMITDRERGFAQRHNFGVCRGVGSGKVLIEAVADDVPLADDDRAHRNFVNFQSALTGAQCFLHPQFITERGRPV